MASILTAEALPPTGHLSGWTCTRDSLDRLHAKSPWQHPSPPGEFAFGCAAVVACSVLYAAFVGFLTAMITSYDAHLGRQRDALCVRGDRTHSGAPAPLADLTSCVLLSRR